MKTNKVPRVHLAELPTPIGELQRLSKVLGGPRILIKRDDLTGLAFGGNKIRKLEFLIADAKVQQADTLITTGGIQSNHCRQTAAAAALHGFRCELVLNGEKPKDDDIPNGNLLLNKLLGAKIHWVSRREQRNAKMEEIAEEVRKYNHKPYIIPVGGSNEIGVLGYVEAMFELMNQLKAKDHKVDYIIFASSSGGTQAGLVLGAKITGYQGQILGIKIDKEENEEIVYLKKLMEIANGAAKILGVNHRVNKDDFNLDYDYLGKGYGKVGELEKNAIKLAAENEGLLLGPVYTARAFGGLIQLIQKGKFQSDETVLFWHTGDTPTIFGYAKELVP